MFGDRLKELRESKNLKQSELANELGIGRTTLSHYELNNRQPDFNTLEKIANYFDVSIDYLVGRTDLKSFNSQIIIDDINHLVKLSDNKGYEFSKLVRNIIDTCFLAINAYVEFQNVAALKVIHNFYRIIWEINMLFGSEQSYSWLSHDKAHSREEYIEQLKQKSDSLINELINIINSKSK
ncbi:helix-turn-helix domain-containing protein [Clostridium tyrobutyricum]|uniref:helix-turn-helix domain-containing protein n=1 Tax=Clostridium tyrobutyricum TaxID=1519 RepID=UPI00068BE315|nr:helix-turn-helix transcriptional regulator [Clostridium tyrobutyricum]